MHSTSETISIVFQKKRNITDVNTVHPFEWVGAPSWLWELGDKRRMSDSEWMQKNIAFPEVGGS